MTLITNIHQKYSKFSKSEQKIADYILAMSRNVSNETIGELSKKIGVSTATISRFVQKLGLKNFSELKIQINLQNKDQIEINGINSQVYDYYTAVIRHTELLENKINIEELIKALNEASNIYVIGVGSSGYTASELAHRLMRMGFRSTSITDPHMMMINCSILGIDDLIIAISASGKTVEVLKAAQLAKDNGADIVCFTCFQESPLIDICCCAVTAYSTNFISQDRFINSQFSMMYQIDVLTTRLLEDHTLDYNMQRTIDAITKIH